MCLIVGSIGLGRGTATADDTHCWARGVWVCFWSRCAALVWDTSYAPCHHLMVPPQALSPESCHDPGPARVGADAAPATPTASGTTAGGLSDPVRLVSMITGPFTG